MNASPRFLLALLLLILVFISNSFAADDAVRPVGHLSANFASAVQKIDSFLSVPLPVSTIQTEAAVSPDNDVLKTASSAGRICSCQILNLASSNYDHRHIAVFAEKTSHGASSDFRAAKSRIKREKKNLKQMFYDKVQVVAEVDAVGSCHSMYIRLKSTDRHLQLYEILNADIL